MKTGLKQYTNNENKNNKNVKKAENKFKQYKYTSGWVALAIISIVYVVISLIGIYVTKLVWYNSLSIASGVCFCLNVFWLISRQKFNLKIRWTILKYYRKLKLDNIVFFGSQNKEDFAYNHVENEEEFSEFLDEKIQRSKIAFWLSFTFYGLLLVAFIFVAIFVK